MTESNPCEAPESTLGSAADPQLIEEVASGQKMVIYALLVNAVFYVLCMQVNPILGLGCIAAIVLAILGIVKLCTGMRITTVVRIFLIILMFIPVISLITLLILNSKATNTLRDAGYKVGLFGASK